MMTEDAPLHPDLPDLTWIIPGELAAMAKPGTGVGLARELRALEEIGIRRILTLTERPLGVGLGRLPFSKLHHLPIEDFTAPERKVLDWAVGLIDEARLAAEPILVHCYMGLGRTGMIVACYLVHRGRTAEEALEFVRRLRPGSVECPEQVDAVFCFWTRRTGDGNPT
ncbi:dual specificity protein phosphatase family protein [bacterium]|nr:dual specificity protein phosphatase family protein [bacterium]